MADHQRIYPIHDPEAAQKPTAPLVTRDASRSEKGEPGEQYPSSYPQRTIPVAYSRPPKKRSCLCKCMCWTISLVLLIIVLLGILAAIIYFGFDPKIPRISIDSMRITQFSLNNDNSLYATFNVNLTIRNPNERIGIYYENGSHLSAWYAGQRLSEGSLPRFYQGHRNTTVLDLTLNGQTQNAGDLLTALQAEQQQTGSVAMNIRARVPVRIRLGRLRLTEWKFLVRCRVVVDSLTENNSIRIRNSSCRFRFRL